MHAVLNYRGNKPTHTQTDPPSHKQTGPITIHCAAASTQCNYQGPPSKPDVPRKWLFENDVFV